MTKNLIGSLLLLGLSTGAAYASAGHWTDGSIEVTLNNETLSASYERPFIEGSNLNWKVGALHTDTFEGRSSHSAQMTYLGFQAIETDHSNYRTGLGLRLASYKLNGSNKEKSNVSGAGLAFGGEYYHVVPSYPRISLGLDAWASPKVTSLGRTRSFLKASVRASYRVINGGDVFIGYRSIQVNHEEGFDGTLEEGLYIGMRLKL